MTNPTAHPAPFRGRCTECPVIIEVGDQIVWQTGGMDRHAACVPADSYATAIAAKLAAERATLEDLSRARLSAVRSRAGSWTLDDLTRDMGRARNRIEELEKLAGLPSVTA